MVIYAATKIAVSVKVCPLCWVPGRNGKLGFGISIVSPEHYVANLEDWKLDALKELDIDIQTVKIPEELEPDFHSSWFFRTIALVSSPYEKTLQLDSDTILCRSLDGQVSVVLYWRINCIVTCQAIDRTLYSRIAE